MSTRGLVWLAIVALATAILARRLATSSADGVAVTHGETRTSTAAAEAGGGPTSARVELTSERLASTESQAPARTATVGREVGRSFDARVWEAPSLDPMRELALLLRPAPAHGSRIPGVLAALQAPAIRATTDAAGIARFDGVADGRYFLSVEHEFLSVAMSDEVHVDAEIEDALLEVPIRRCGALAGRVIDQRGAPIAGARVFTLASNSFPSEPLVSEATLDPLPRPGAGTFGNLRLVTTDDRGRFVVGGVLPTRESRAWAFAEGYAWTSAMPFAVSAGERAELTLVLRDGARLRVVVVDDREQPVTRCRATLLPWDSLRPDGELSLDVASDDGAVVFEHLREGTYALEVNAKGFRECRRDELAIVEAGDNAIVVRLVRGDD